MGTRIRALSWVVLSLAAIAPALIALNFIYRFGVNVISWDEWEILPFFDDLYAGTLTLGRLFSQHNEHRIFFPRIIMLGVGHFTHYNTVSLMYVSWAFVFLALVALFVVHRQLYGKSLAALALFIPTAWFVFTERQMENFLWGWQIQITGCTAMFICAVVLLRNAGRGWGRFVLAAACCVVSSFSFASGLLVWPAIFCELLYVLFQSKENLARRVLLKMTVAWVALSLFCGALYLHHYQKPGGHPSLEYALRHPLLGLYVFTGTWGGALVRDVRPEVAAGAVLLALAAVLFVAATRGRVDPKRFVISIPLFVFAFGAIAMITLGRSGFGVEGVCNASRYATVSLLGVLGVYYGILALEAGALRSTLAGAMGVIFALGIFGSLDGALEFGAGLRQHQRDVARVLRTAEQRTAKELEIAYPRAGAVATRLKIMKKYRLNVCADPGVACEAPQIPAE